jgi:uncharacterized membrane protein YhaH (DUF805 family)
MNWYLKVLQNYIGFEGRARRSEYWYFMLFNIIISIALSILGQKVPALAIVGTLYSLGVLLPNIAVAIRRMHDVGKSGWYCLIPLYNLILCCTEGDKGDNQYGPDPKGNGGMDIANHFVEPN